MLQFKDYAKILEVQRPMTCHVNVWFFFFESQRCTKVCFCFLRLHWLQVASRVPAVQQSNIVLGMKRATDGIKSGLGATCHFCKAEFIYFNFITKHISFGRNQRVHNQYKWLAVHPTIAMKWSGEIVEWLLCSGQSTLCFIWYLLFFAFSLCWNISMGICIWRCSDHKERYLLWKYRSKVEGSWRVKVPCEQELQIYETLPNTVYGTRHGMCVLVAKVFKSSFALN